jgi:molecular chaperone DnaJ
MATTDFYELLEVSRGCSDDDLKKAYRRLARELHPDANPGNAEAEERFKQVTLAYEVLRDPEKRQQYDRYGIDGIRGTGSAGAGDPFGAGSPFGAGLGDIFEAFFGGGGGFGGGGRGRGPSGPPRGPDLETVLELQFTDAVFGSQQEIEARVPVHCTTCSGSGAAPGTSPSTCPTCQGQGEVRRVRHSILGQMVTAGPCGDCGATGQIIPSPCSECRGDGRVIEQKSFLVDVPAGVDDGTTLRLSGKGGAGPRGGPVGDLFVHLRVKPHEVFQRQGYDLVHELHIPFTQAALGAHLDYETLDGDDELHIHPGTPSGKEIRLRAKGVPYVDGRGRGDLRVHLVVDTPTSLSAQQEDLLRRFAEERGETVAPPETGLLSKIRGAFKP